MGSRKSANYIYLSFSVIFANIFIECYNIYNLHLTEVIINQKWVKMYMDFAFRAAQESHAVRLKVGAFFVSPDGVMSMGINGLPAGQSNICEKEVNHQLVTKDEVSHAEENLFAKLMRQGVCTKGGRLFLTHSPCIHCAKIIVGAGITHVHYVNEYRDRSGLEWLQNNGIVCIKEKQNDIQ